MKFVAVLAALLCSLLFNSVGYAKDDARLTMVWRIEPQELEPAKVVKSNKVVARAPLVPMDMVVTSSPVLTKDGEELLPTGTQLAVLDGPTMVACNTYMAGRPDLLGLPIGPPKNKYLCLIDQDADGDFDTYANLRSIVMTAFVGTWKMPKAAGELQASPYGKGDPATWKGQDFAEFRYLGKTWGGTYRFGMTPRRAGDDNVVFLHIRADQKFKKSDFPARFTAFGGEFEVLGLEKGKPRIRAVTPFPSQPFFILGYGG